MSKPILPQSLSNPFLTSLPTWKNGMTIDHIQLNDRAFLYGDGFFTTAAIHHQKMVLEPYHIARLLDGIHRLNFNINLNTIKTQLQNYLQTQNLKFGLLKIIISRGIGTRGYLAPNTQGDVYFMGQASTVPLYSNTDALPIVHQPITIALPKIRLGLSSPSITGLKTINRIEQVLLRTEIEPLHKTEGLVFDLNDNLVCGISSNCFYYANNQWHTPSLKQAGIWGTARAFLIDQFARHHIPLTFSSILSSQINQIESLFLTNALGIYPVSHIDSPHYQQILDLKNVDKLFAQLYP